ncbi:MAG: exopolysaccharide biosynthesis WecB/TagA/CpsF family protein [Cellvibrionaceae bacterium]
MQEKNKIIASNIFFDNMSFLDAVEKIEELAASPHFSYVVTPNIDHIARLCDPSTEKSLHDIYRRAALSLCDSRILQKLLRVKGKNVEEVITGSGLTKYLFDKVLTGSDKALVVGVEDVFIDRLRSLYPALNIHHINPSMGFINKKQEVDDLLERIKRIDANYLFLSVGSPRQEVLAGKISTCDSIGGVGLCVGASVLFMVGAEKRAPRFLQKLHLEWAYRILQNPQRLAVRYFKNFLSLPAIIKSL